MESSSYLLIDENGKEVALFSGDALFIGDVGRPDLAVKSDLTEEDLAGYLYDSLHNKIPTLADDVIVYPNHGASSACGKNMSDKTSDTLENQKKTNYALQAKSKEEFIDKVLDGLVAPPQYFPKNAIMNKTGYQSLDDVMQNGLQALSPAAFDAVAIETEALILDVRNPDEFAKGFIPNSINIGLDGTFATWVGTLITNLKQEILLVTKVGRVEETILRLSRVGYDNTIGFLKGGFESWANDNREIETIKTIDAEDFIDSILLGANSNVLDVRKQSEYDSEHVKEIKNFPLDFINQHMC